MGRGLVPRRFLAAVVLGLVACPAAAQTAKDVQTERNKLEQTQKQLREQREKVADARRRETSLLAELEQIERRLTEKQQDVIRIDGRMQRLQGELQTLRQDIHRLEASRGGQQEALGRRLRAMYKIHAQGAALPVILTGEDSMVRLAAVRRLGSLAALDARVIQEYRVISDNLADRKKREETRQHELATLRAEAKEEQAEVDREAAKRRILLTRVRGERAYHERVVGELSEASRRLEAFIQELQARQREREARQQREREREAKQREVKQPRLAKVPPARTPIDVPAVGFGNLRGRLPWPTDGRIVSAFGPQVHPRFGTKTVRNGVDIEAAGGTDVAAVYPGQVVYTGWFKGYGNLIILDHGHEYYTLYAHVAEILVKEGDEVRAAQRIGTVGDTGSLSGPRLYFEVRYQGKPQDPEQWLRQRS